jgi:hypothetical protein
MEDMCHVTLRIDSTDYNLTFGAGRWIADETAKPGPNLFPSTRARSEKVVGSFGWKDENTLELMLRYIESPHAETMFCRFDKDKIQVEIKYSIAPDSKQPAIKGKIK